MTVLNEYNMITLAFYDPLIQSTSILNVTDDWKDTFDAFLREGSCPCAPHVFLITRFGSKFRSDTLLLPQAQIEELEITKVNL